MKATAFAPGHISGFFEPIYHKGDVAKTGSRGAGLCVSLGAISEVIAEGSTNQNIEIYVNGKRANAPVTQLALNYLIRANPMHLVVKTKLELPTGQGFGMSAASALSATYALVSITGISQIEAIKASHRAEVQLKTGLGDVMASSFGGIEIRKEAGLPPWGIIEHIPGLYELVLCVVGKKLDTKKILLDSNKSNDIVNYGKYCTKKLLEKPSIENFFTLSQIFAMKTNLLDKRVTDAIKVANQFGMASMCMLGNSVFAIGKTDMLCQALSKFGKIYVCVVDQNGARIFDK